MVNFIFLVGRGTCVFLRIDFIGHIKLRIRRVKIQKLVSKKEPDRVFCLFLV